MGEITSASKLVDLLSQAGLLKPEERSEAVNMSRQTGLDITKLLTMHGYVSDRVIKLGQDAVVLLQQREIDNFIAVKAIAKGAEKNVDLTAALDLPARRNSGASRGCAQCHEPGGAVAGRWVSRKG
jgi:hypothetical protein